TVDKLEKGAQKRIPSFKKKYPHKRNTEKKTVSREKLTFEQLDTQKEALHCLRLLVHTHPEKVGFGKKKAEIAEVALSGTVEEQLAYAKEKMGKTIAVSEIFEANEDVDVRAVTRGFGFGGVVARFGVKTFRPKAKYIRAVGSISPLRPKTVMFTVARPGQLGYHNRTEFNKRILTISDDAKKINPKSGFMHYGVIQNEYMLLAGSVPGPVKRLIGLRTCVRPQPRNDYRIGNITITSSTAGAV
ncbi:MAG: 50S ribosomal protein L3, partial [archaeon]|nr:50S ribosomal protein L3 [archaeon]